MKSFDFKRFFDISADMLCIADQEGHFLDVNEAFCQTLGYSKAYLLADTFLKLIHPDDIQKTQKEIERLNAGEQTVNFENRYKHKDGYYLTLVWMGQLDQSSGEVYAAARNVTGDRRREYKLAQIEAALSKSTILGKVDPNGIILSVNEQFCNISGYSQDELIGNSYEMVNSGEHDNDFFADMWQTISAKNVWSGLIKNKKRNGDLYHVVTTIAPLIDHEGNITSYLSIQQDITDSINYESELDRILKILNETSATAKIGGWELDVASGELTWTDETFRILEVEKRADQKPILPEGIELFIPEHKPVIEDAVNKAIEYGEPYSLELQAKTAKGNVRWVNTNGKANYENGKVVTLSGTIQDIDQKKKIEQRYNLERQKSIQSSKLASLGELAASMAHEINNPLGIISGYGELMLADDSLSEANSKKLGVILKSCERISHIVGSLKKFSRKDDGNTKKAHELRAIIQEAISLAQPRIKRERVKLDFQDAVDLKIYCQPFEIEQVFLNLINNAIDAVKDQEKRMIELNLFEGSEDIECRVVDSGSGIPESISGQIFEPFFTSKAVEEGTGLGLSIVKDILAGHGASIKYEDDKSQTSFLLKFPKYKG